MPEPVTAGDDPLWYKDAIIYQLHVKSFFDANDDGIGDFRGLISKLDYIADLGATAIWLLPFYPSPRRDDGYDIALYEGVSPDYGTMDEARRFIAEAHARGLRVITELVINHTSDQHPWFQAARRAPKGSRERDFYVWADDDAGYPGVPIVFCDVEKSNWTYDEVAGQYFWHRFYAHQPDLNFDNPEVLERVLSVMRFWLDLGVDGLRLDAVPYLVEREGTDCANLPETHAILRRIRAHLDAHYTGRMLLAEANLWPEDTQQYFGPAADECHMAFHFPLMPRMYMAIAREERFPITDILRQTPEIPATCQWAIFLRNHDELTLETVTDAERDYLWSVYAADRRARINLGIRRRLAPLLERDRRRVELMNSLLLTLPGTPVIYYGDELGMGDNIHLGDRDGVRTPMQWTPDRNGGFSRADPEKLVLPAIQDPLYGFAAVNVEAQQRDAHSLLNWTRRFLAVRRQTAAFGRGSFRLLFPQNRRVLAYLREHEGEAVLCVANLAHTLQSVELDLTGFERRVPVDLVSGTPLAALSRAPLALTLPPYGFYAFRLSASAQEPAWRNPPPEALPEFVTLVVRDGVMAALAEPYRATLEREVLPAYLARRRWFEGRAEDIRAVRLGWAMRLPGTEREVALVEIEADIAGTTERYLMPLCIAFEDQHPPAVAEQLALTRVRQGRRVGFLTDAAVLDGLAAGVVRALREGAQVPLPDGGAIVFSPTARLQGVSVERGAPAELVQADEPAGSLVVTDEVAVKLFRHMAFGPMCEERTARRLTEIGFPNAPPLIGAVARADAAGRRAPVALVYGYVRNQGSAADWVVAQVQRALDAAAGTMEGAHQRFEDEVAGVLPQLRTVGRRLAELHAALAEPDRPPPEDPATAAARWHGQAAAALARALATAGTDGAIAGLATGSAGWPLDAPAASAAPSAIAPAGSPAAPASRPVLDTPAPGTGAAGSVAGAPLRSSGSLPPGDGPDGRTPSAGAAASAGTPAGSPTPAAPPAGSLSSGGGPDGWFPSSGSPMPGGGPDGRPPSAGASASAGTPTGSPTPAAPPAGSLSSGDGPDGWFPSSGSPVPGVGPDGRPPSAGASASAGGPAGSPPPAAPSAGSLSSGGGPDGWFPSSVSPMPGSGPDGRPPFAGSPASAGGPAGSPTLDALSASSLPSGDCPDGRPLFAGAVASAGGPAGSPTLDAPSAGSLPYGDGLDGPLRSSGIPVRGGASDGALSAGSSASGAPAAGAMGVRLAELAVLARPGGGLEASFRARLADPVPLAQIHGRCDLSHVLVTAGDAVFAGALGGLPGEDGDARNSVWRDVAELVASVEIALAGLATGEAAAGAEAPALRAELAAAFRARAERAIVGAYVERAPAAPGRPLMDVFLLEALARAVPSARPEARPALIAGLLRQARRLTRNAEADQTPE